MMKPLIILVNLIGLKANHSLISIITTVATQTAVWAAAMDAVEKSKVEETTVAGLISGSKYQAKSSNVLQQQSLPYWYGQ